MKLIIFYACIGLTIVLLSESGLANSSAESVLDNFNLTQEYCQKANNITDEDFIEILTVFKTLEILDSKEDSGGNDDETEIEIEELDNVAVKFKCYALCFFEEMGLLNEDGKFDIEQLKKFGESNENSMEIVNECKKTHDEEQNACEYAFQMLACLAVGILGRKQ